MAYSGWLSFGGQEIINEARTRAYVSELVPGLTMPTNCKDSVGDLAAVLEDKPYSKPLTDDAPWVDVDDPNTHNFCGFFPLSVSGLTDSTREATVLEANADGGAVTGFRRATREIRVSGLLIGVDDAAVAAGKTWLRTALDGACNGPCEPSDLCFFIAPPQLDVAMGDYTSEAVPLSSLSAPTGRWSPETKVFNPGSSGVSLITPNADEPLPCDEIFWHWNVQAVSGTQIILETVNERGVATTQTFMMSASATTITISDKADAEKMSYARLRVLTAGQSVTVNSVQIEYRLPGDPDLCFEKYLRQLRMVTCIDGPRTTNLYSPSDGAMEAIEFSFVAAVPWIYGAERPVVEVNGQTVNAKRPNTTVYNMSRTVPDCTLPKITPPIMDPDCPPIPPPPRSAVPITSCAAEPTFYDPYAVYIPEDVIPLWSETVPVLSLKTSGKAIRKVKVRFLPRPLEGQLPEDLDPCSACGHFVIDYIPPHATFTLNGMEERAYITQYGNRVSSANHLLSGPTADSMFQWPAMACGTGYYIILDVAGDELLAGLELSVYVRE